MDRIRVETESRLAMIAGPVVVLAMVGWLAGHDGPGRSGAAGDAATVLLTSGPWALGWLLAAIGLGWPLRCRLLGDHTDALAIQTGLRRAAVPTPAPRPGAGGGALCGRRGGVARLGAEGRVVRVTLRLRRRWR